MLRFEPIPGLRIVGPPRKGPTVRPTRPGLANLAHSAIHGRVIEALRRVSAGLRAEGVRHALIGGLAVVVHGWPRLTQDIDLLVGNEAWERLPGGALEPRVAMPEELDGIAIDYLPIDIGGDFLDAALDRPFESEGIPVAPPEVVVCTKLIRHAMRDQADIVELIKAGLFDRERVRVYLAEHTPMLLPRWAFLVEQADDEASREER